MNQNVTEDSPHEDSVRKERRLNALTRIATPLIAIIFSILVGAIVIALAGVNPIYAYSQLLYGAFGTVNNFSETLVKTTPLLIIGIGLAIARAFAGAGAHTILAARSEDVLEERVSEIACSPFSPSRTSCPSASR